jgi:hypothetical protein
MFFIGQKIVANNYTQIGLRKIWSFHKKINWLKSFVVISFVNVKLKRKVSEVSSACIIWVDVANPDDGSGGNP